MLHVPIGELFVRCVQAYAPVAPQPRGAKYNDLEWRELLASRAVFLVMLAHYVPDRLLEEFSYNNTQGITGPAVFFVDGFLRAYFLDYFSEYDQWFEYWGLNAYNDRHRGLEG